MRGSNFHCLRLAAVAEVLDVGVCWPLLSCYPHFLCCRTPTISVVGGAYDIEDLFVFVKVSFKYNI